MSTIKLEILKKEFDEIASILEICGYRLAAKNFGCTDGDFTEVLPEDRDPEVFDPTEYESWQVW